MSTFILVAAIRLDSGDIADSSVPVVHPSTYIDARILSWGSINRSIPVPSGLLEVGDAQIRVSDTDFRLRNLFVNGTQTPIDRQVDIHLVEEGASYASTNITIYTGVISRFALGDGYCELHLHDITLSWLDEEWPGRMEDGSYAPTIFGSCIQNSSVEQNGLIPLPHAGFDVANGDRWILSIHTVNDVVGIYRHNLDGTWDLVDPSEYSVTEEEITIGGISYTRTLIDFTDEQAEGVEIRADVEGWNARPAWGSLGAASGLLRNPIDFFINIMETVQAKIGQTLLFDEDAIQDIRTLFETVIDTSPAQSYYCDGAVTESITIRSLLSRLLTSFNLDLFQTVDGKISLSFMQATDSGREVFTETLHILEGSFSQSSPDHYVNRIKCKLAYNYALGDWSIEQIHNNTVDQEFLGQGSPVVPKIKSSDLEMWFVRNRVTAADVAAHRAGFLALNSYMQEFELPLEIGAERELCEQVGLTITSGLAVGGFTNQECRTEGISHNLDDFTTRISSRIYREQERNAAGSSLTYELEGDLTVETSSDAEITETV